MVVAASTTPNLKAPSSPTSFRSQSNPRRPPLQISDNFPAVSRRPKSREVSSRYLSTSSSSFSSGSSSSTFSNSSSRRCPSPGTGTGTIKRPASAERRIPATPMTAAAKLLVSSTKRLSVSFQGESFAVSPMSKKQPAKVAPSPSLRKATPERRKVATTTTPAPKKAEMERQPWPSRSRPVAPPPSLSRSLDLGCEGRKLINGSTKVVRALRESLLGDGDKTLHDLKLRRSMSRDDETVKWVRDAHDANCVNGSEILICDTESVFSESNSGSLDNKASVAGSKGGRVRSSVVPARVWPDASSRLKRTSEPGSPIAPSNSLKRMIPPNIIVPKKFVNDSPGTSPRGYVNNRGFSSPLRGSLRPASPSRPRTPVSFEKSSLCRGAASPSRVRNGTVGAVVNSTPSTPSVLYFGADVRRAKVGDNGLGDAHFLRLLHNRHLQWRFVNARAEASLTILKTNAERSLYNAWKKMSDMHEAVSYKRKELQWLRQMLKLVSILKDQMPYLEEWALLDNDHCTSLSSASESLKASVIRLPLVGGARADIQDVKAAICSAADVMQAMASSVCSLLAKVEEVNSLVAEVANTTSQEHSYLNECKEMLSTLSAMQVKDCSLRAHILQLKCSTSASVVGGA